jgi:EAL domain-containing protein (putative c-di-GMP-specific phosphodiesterase class I)
MVAGFSGISFYEALARWRDPDLNPGVVFPTATKFVTHDRASFHSV